MSAPVIHPTAIVHAYAKLADGVEIGPYAVVENNVEIGEDCWVGPHALVAWGTRMGKRCKVHHAATVGTIPQDLKFAGEETLCRIGDDCIIREYVSINRGTKAAGETVIGNRCALLSYCHVGHDCIIGDNLVVSNNLAMAGHVHVGNHVTIGGNASFHQFTRIGDHAMIGANTYVMQDVVPFSMIAGQPTRIVGTNKIGLERRGFSAERRSAISKAYRILFRQNLLKNAAVEKLSQEFAGNTDVAQLTDFVNQSQRGLVQMGAGAED